MSSLGVVGIKVREKVMQREFSVVHPVKKKAAKKLITLNAARKLIDEDLINRFGDHTEDRSITYRVVLERMKRDGFTDLYYWIWAGPEPTAAKQGGEAAAPPPQSKNDGTLRQELTKMATAPIFTKACMREPERCARFCSEEGNVRDMAEDDLSPPQKRMLGLIRDRYTSWERSRR
jgi:hypothetical protein